MENELAPIADQLRAALKASQTGHGSYGPNYNGAMLAGLVETIARNIAAPLAPSDTQGAEAGQIEITEEDAAMLNSMLDAPPKPNAALTNAFALARQAPDAVRDAALEEAALVCDENAAWHRDTQRCADAIRALKSTAPKLAEAGKEE